MMTQRKLTFGALAMVCLALGTTGWAQKKKSAGDDVMAEAARAVQLAQQGATEEAIKIFTKVIEARPKDARLYNDRGGIYLTTMKFAEAEADFAKAIELAPKDYAGYSYRGAALVELNRPDDAMVDLNKALELKPDDSRTLERRGLAHYKLKNYQAALADYNKALEVTPDSTLALSRRADAFVALQQFGPAQADLQAYLKIRPEDFGAEERLRYVNAKLNPPPPPTAAPPTPVPTPPPIKLLTRVNVFIALGALLFLGIIAAIIAKMRVSRSSVD